MKPITKLRRLGFRNSTVMSEDAEKALIRIRTANGWVYERFANEAEAVAWAAKHTPENE